MSAGVGGTVVGASDLYTLATTATQFSSVGPYPITVTLGLNPNYNITSTNGTLTVDRKSVVEGKSVDLGGRRIIKKKRTAMVAGAVNGDTLAYTLEPTA